MKPASHIAIVGAGLVGAGWALVFARAGFAVRVYDGKPEVLSGFLPWAKESCEDLMATGLIDDAEKVLSNLVVCADLKEAVHGASYVQESVFETVEVKTAISLELDGLIGTETIVGSSSSGIPASKFTEQCRNRDRFLIAHPVNPPHLVPVVELVPAPWTTSGAIERARELMISIGQSPVTLTREIDGFVLNRLQGALLNEAWALYADGFASLEDIDATVSQGLGFRWVFMGPFETIDLNAPGGVSDYAARLGEMYFDMAKERKATRWSCEAIENAQQERRAKHDLNELQEQRVLRDARLMQIAKFKKSLTKIQ